MSIQQALSFLKCLDSSPDAVYSGFWMAESGGVVPGKGSVHILAEELEPAYKSILESGTGGKLPTFHVTLNQTNVLGRKTENILSVRVLCVDLDREVLDNEYREIRDTFNPALIVESSPNKYHLYWRISPDITIPEWKAIQTGLALWFTADYNLRNPSATIRIPGFPRLTKSGEPFTPRIKHRGNQSVLTLTHVHLLFPDIDKAIEKANIRLGEIAKEQSRLSKELRKGKKITELGAGIGRNALLYQTLTDFVLAFPWQDDLLSEAIDEEAHRINESYPEPLPATEVADVVKKVTGKREAFVTKKREAQLIIMEDYVEETSAKTSAINCTPETINISKFDNGKPIAFNVTRIKTKLPLGQPSIPASLKDSARLFASRLFKKNPKKLAKKLSSGFTSKSYEDFAHYFCRNLELIGKFRISGPSVSVKDTNFWGETIHGFQTLGKESFLAYASEVINALSSTLLANDEYSKDFKTAPTSALLSRIALVLWKVAQLYPPAQRQDDNLICFQDGIFDLTTGTFSRNPDAPLLHSHPIACYWNYETEKQYERGLSVGEIAPVFAKYFADWFPKDPLTAKVLFRFFGYCCTTSRAYQTFAFFHGPGGAGKGSLAEVIQGIVGSRNSISLDYKTLDGGFKLAEMHDRLVIAVDEAEGSEDEHLTRLSLIKKLTGGQRMQIERKYQLPFEDEIVGKAILMANEAPTYQDKGGSIQRRILALGFEQTFAGMSVELPSHCILKSDASKIATISALMWSKAIQAKEPRPFHVRKSLAIEVGEREVVHNIDIVKKLCDNFLEQDHACKLKSAVLKELVYYVSERENIKLSGRPEARMKQEIKSRYPGVKYLFSLRDGHERTRGYRGLKLNREAILAEYPDITSDMGSLVKYQNLAEAVLPDAPGKMIELDD